MCKLPLYNESVHFRKEYSASNITRIVSCFQLILIDTNTEYLFVFMCIVFFLNFDIKPLHKVTVN